MEKLILAGYLSACAAFLTAVISMVKLVVEKENKVSEFRQEWTNSVKCNISDLAAKLNNQTALIHYQARLTAISNLIMAKIEKKESVINEKRLDEILKTIYRVREEISVNRDAMFKAYSMCQLHFKPQDADFKPIEVLFDEIFQTNNEVFKRGESQKDHSALNDEARENNYKKSQEIVQLSRAILKTEWERVKTGEKAFTNTKKLSKYGGLITLLALMVLGYLSYKFTTKLPNETELNTTQIDTKVNTIKLSDEDNKCWELTMIEQAHYKFNKCSGQLNQIAIK